MDIRTLHQDQLPRLVREQRRGKRDSWGSLITTDQETAAIGSDSIVATSGANGEDNAVGDGSSTDDTAVPGDCGTATIVTTATSNAASASATAPGEENGATDKYSVSLGGRVDDCSVVAADDGNDDDDGGNDGNSDSDGGYGWEDVGADGGVEGYSGDEAWEKAGVEDGPSPTFEYDEATMRGMRPPPFGLPVVIVGKSMVQVSRLRGRHWRPLLASMNRSFEREMTPPLVLAGQGFGSATPRVYVANFIRATVFSLRSYFLGVSNGIYSVCWPARQRLSGFFPPVVKKNVQAKSDHAGVANARLWR